MVLRYGTAIVALTMGVPANAQSALEVGFAGAMRGCEEWVLNPSSWAEGIEPFVSAVGLGDQMGLVASVNEASLPPKELRVANHYWRINSTEKAGYVLVVSDRLPMCHITGGGGTDLQPVIESVLDGQAFQDRWEKLEDKLEGDMVSTTYRSREEPAFSMVISRATSPGQRMDRVQVLATALFDLGN